MTKKLKMMLESTLFIAVGFLLMLLASTSHSQTRIETADASAAQATELHCTRSDSGDWECAACVRYTVQLDTGQGIKARTDRACGAGRLLRAANANRVQTVADALVPQALRQNGFESVDAGQP